MMVSSITLIINGIGFNGAVSVQIKPYSNGSEFNAAQ